RPSRHFPRDLERLLIALGRDDHEPADKLLGLDKGPVGHVRRSDNLATRFQTPSQVQDVCIELLLPRTERRVHLLLLCGGRRLQRCTASDSSMKPSLLVPLGSPASVRFVSWPRLSITPPWASPSFRNGQEVTKAGSFRGANTISSTADRPVTATPATSSPRLVGSCIAISAMTAACATLDHAANAIKLRCAEGLRAASTKKRPSVAYMVQNIGAVVPAVGRRPARKEVTRG